MSADQTAYAQQTSEIVAAYVMHNHVALTDVPALIRSVHDTLSTLGQAPAAEAPAEPLKPAVPIKKSVTDDYIVSLEDGRKFKSMKRYLAGLGMTPADYRAKWGLPSDYPMVAPNYAAKRSELAKSSGLGSMRRGVAAPEPERAEQPRPAPQPEPETAPAPAPKKARAKKAA